MSDAKEAKAEAKAAKAKAKALRPWYLKKRFWFLGIIGLIVVVSIASSGGDSTNSDANDYTQSQEDLATDNGAQTNEESNSGETVSQENARKSAKNYLDTLAFSRTGLIKQLEFEGFSTEDATYAVDALNPDWNEQAAKSAKNYLDTMAFSRAGLIEQLIFEGFTQEQAEYGVSTTGL
jgi:hypothetical protein